MYGGTSNEPTRHKTTSGSDADRSHHSQGEDNRSPQSRKSPRQHSDGSHRIQERRESKKESNYLTKGWATMFKKKDKKGSDKQRIIYSDMVPKEVQTKHTVISILLGQDSNAEHVMFVLGVKNQPSQIVLWALWLIGACMGLLVVAEVLPLNFVWASLLMLPLPLVTIMLLSVDLAREITQSLDLYIIYILQFALFVDGIFYCRADRRAIFWCCYLPTMIASGLVDAYPQKYRVTFATAFFGAAVVILVVWNCLLIFKWKVVGGHATRLANISFILHHISDQLTLFVFYLRHIWCSIVMPGHFVMIKAEVLTGHTGSPRLSNSHVDV